MDARCDDQRQVEQQGLRAEARQKDADPAQKQGEGRQERPQQSRDDAQQRGCHQHVRRDCRRHPRLIQIVKTIVSQPRISVIVSRRISAQLSRRSSKQAKAPPCS